MLPASGASGKARMAAALATAAAAAAKAVRVESGRSAMGMICSLAGGNISWRRDPALDSSVTPA
jgi:hypothetical protein